MKIIDSSIWLDFINKKSAPKLNARIQSLIESKAAAWCPMVRLELQRSTKERESALALLDQVLSHFPIDDDTWDASYMLARAAYRAGKTIPNSDILIYATAQRHGAKILHNDKHFDWLDELTRQKIAERFRS